jgi:phage terminase large subunit-like protein
VDPIALPVHTHGAVNDCPPRWATPRTSRRTYGPQVAARARELGFQFLPWQRRVLSVALEQAGRRPAYRDCLVSVPRQSGKSSLALSLIVWRLLSAPDQLVLYSAQNRVAARRKLLHTWWPRIASSPLAGRFRIFRGFGNEALFCDNGSRLELLSATESAGHGESVDLAIIDEAWVHVDATIEQSVRPTMATRPDAQLWSLSTAGTVKSLWWRGKLDAARAVAELGHTDAGTCLLEWSAADDLDVTDETTWPSFMPALGRLIEVATVAQDMAAMALPEWRRAYANQWPEATAEGWHLIDKAVWEASAL